jgi:hypothetical protein
MAALSAFLDVSSLNLAAPQAPPFFGDFRTPPGARGVPGSALTAGAGRKTAARRWAHDVARGLEARNAGSALIPLEDAI